MTGVALPIRPISPSGKIEKTDLIFIPALWGNPNATVRKHPENAVLVYGNANTKTLGAQSVSVGTGS